MHGRLLAFTIAFVLWAIVSLLFYFTAKDEEGAAMPMSACLGALWFYGGGVALLALLICMAWMRHR